MRNSVSPMESRSDLFTKINKLINIAAITVYLSSFEAIAIFGGKSARVDGLSFERACIGAAPRRRISSDMHV